MSLKLINRRNSTNKNLSLNSKSLEIFREQSSLSNEIELKQERTPVIIMIISFAVFTKSDHCANRRSNSDSSSSRGQRRKTFAKRLL